MDDMGTNTCGTERLETDRFRIFLICLIGTTSVLCLLTVIGLVLQYGKSEKPAVSNRELLVLLQSLQTELDALKTDTVRTLSELADTNQTLATTNETLAANISQVSESLSSFTSENLKLINDIAGLTSRDDSTARQAGESISKLTSELADANRRIDQLSTSLQDKTEEAADLLIKVNALVEMVARLRVTAGITSEDIDRAAAAISVLGDANSLPPLLPK